MVVVMNSHLLALYIFALFLAMISPGPDMMFILAIGARGGPKAGIVATLGVATSEVIQISAVAAGLSTLFSEVPTAFTAIRLGGATYLLYLGVRSVLGARHGGVLKDAQATEPMSGWLIYLRGTFTNLVNPKMITFVVAFLPQFVDRSLGHVGVQFAILGAIFIAFEMLIDGGVGLASGWLGDRLARWRRARQGLDIGSGAIMSALAVRLATESV